MKLAIKNPKAIFWSAFSVSLPLFFYPFRVHEGLGLGLDKVVHFGIFAVLGFYGFRSYENKIYHTATLLAVYAFVIEFVQGAYLPSRNSDLYDAIAGCIGLGVVFLYRKTGK